MKKLLSSRNRTEQIAKGNITSPKWLPYTRKKPNFRPPDKINTVLLQQKNWLNHILNKPEYNMIIILSINHKIDNPSLSTSDAKHQNSTETSATQTTQLVIKSNRVEDQGQVCNFYRMQRT